MRAAALAAVSVIAPAASLAGCGGSSNSGGSSGTAPPRVSAAQLTRAADISSSAVGYRTVLSMRETVPGVGQISIDGSGRFGRQSGSLTLEMRLPGVAAVALGGSLRLSIVIHDGIMYMKLPSALISRIPGVKPWLEINLAQIAKQSGSGVSSLLGSSQQLSDPGQYLAYLRATSAGSLRSLGPATVDGVATTHYHADIDLANLSRAFPAAERPAIARVQAQLSKQIAGGQLPVDAYVDSDNLVRRIVITEPLTLSGKGGSVSMQMDFPAYGPQPPPAIPPAAQVTNFSALAHGLP